MDPNTALDQLIDNVLNSDFESAQENLNDLQAWHAGGGFLPTEPRGGAVALP